ncbi:MAG: hypothetical protein R2724_06280 [Bryobacterales bacterium]
MDRRLFLLSSASAAALAQSPNETIRMGLIGAGGRGRTVTGEFKKDPKLQVYAVCDVYEPNLEAGLSTAGPLAAQGLSQLQAASRRQGH